MLIPTFSPSLWRLPAVAAAAVCRWNTVSDTAGQDTITTSAILHQIHWLGRFFVGRYSYVGDIDGAIKVAISVPSIGTLSTFSCPLCLILSYCVSTAAVRVVLNILSLNYPLLPSSFPISFFPYYLPTAFVSTSLRLCRRIFFRPYPPSLSSSISDSSVLINLCSIHRRSRPPSVSHHPVCLPLLILIVLNIFSRLWCSLLSITFPCILLWCSLSMRPPLRPRRVYYWSGRFLFQSGGGSSIPGRGRQHPAYCIESVECSKVLGALPWYNPQLYEFRLTLLCQIISLGGESPLCFFSGIIYVFPSFRLFIGIYLLHLVQQLSLDRSTWVPVWQFFMSPPCG